MIAGQGPIALAVGAVGVVWTFLLSSILSLFFLPLWETARYRLKTQSNPIQSLNFEKSTFPTNDVPNNTCSRPDVNSADPDQTALLAGKSLQKNKCYNVKIIRAVFQVLYFNIKWFFFSITCFHCIKT